MCWTAPLGWPFRQAQHAGRWLSQTSMGGQRSCLVFLCQTTPPLVPTYPLSRGSPWPVTQFPLSFLWSHNLQLSLNLCISQLLLALLSHFLSLCYFFPLSHCFLYLLSFLTTVIFGQQLSRHACRVNCRPPFPWLLCLSLSLSFHPSFHVLCPVVALEGSVYLAAAEAGFICLRASLWKGIFSPLENCSLPTVTLSA